MSRRLNILTKLIASFSIVACVVACSAGFGFWRGIFVTVNIAAFTYYGIDKRQAVRGGWRVPELVLLAMAAIGGTPGSLLGQLAFNHKINKSRFRRLFRIVVLVQIAVLTAWFLR